MEQKNAQIKRIIFDLDETLIDWKEEYWQTINKTFEELSIQYTNDDIKKVRLAVGNYEDGTNLTYNREKMLQSIEKNLGYKLPSNFIDIWLKHLSSCVTDKIDNSIIETLKYLKEKYDLVILTNWFKESQENRLKKANLYNFFTEIYTADNVPMKPNKESFILAKGNYKETECIMIGDNFRVDIEGALNAGMKAIYIKKDGKKIPEVNNKNFIKTIYKISDLMQIL